MPGGEEQTSRIPRVRSLGLGRGGYFGYCGGRLMFTETCTPSAI